MRLAVSAAASLTLGLLGQPGPSVYAAPAPGGPLPASVQAFVDADCHRCHTVPGAPATHRLDSCQGCHVWIRDVSQDPARRAKALAAFPLWERYERNVATYLEVPSLEAALHRLEPAWVRSYLADPHDLRPHLPETMPRFDLDPAQVDALVVAFAQARAAVPPSPAPSRSRMAQGEALFSSKGCVACHTLGGRHTLAKVPLAPDLQHARTRVHPDVGLAWIRDPRSVSPAASMPTVPMTPEEALALRDYVWLVDPKAVPSPALSATDLDVSAAGPVSWAQVEERVFGKICVHCHMDPAQNQGRAGPGNAGGFGWNATGIELQTYEGVVAVRDRIPAALARRVEEGPRDVVAVGQAPRKVKRHERPGMPLGLPALSDEDRALVLAWIAQGTPK
jgi:mono/diheme cytochrome c family protein